jgi:hypothetical protein
MVEMNRPLVYSTPQRVAQYNTVKNAGLNRTDYREAIRKLNKAEMKFRTAQKLKEKKEAQAEEQRQKRAVELAKVRAEAEKKKRDEKNRKRREANALAKANRKAERTQAFISSLVENMKNRSARTYSFADAEVLGISNKDLVELIARNSDNGMWVLSVDEGEHYTLSDNTRTRLANYLKNELTVEEAEYESDGRVSVAIKSANSVTVTPLEPKNKNKKNRGMFFKYHSKTDIDLSRCGIWNETFVSNYDDTCLVVALRNGGLSVQIGRAHV